MMLLEADEQQNDNDNDNNTRAVDDVARDLFLACQQKPLRYDIIQHLLRENPEIAKSKDRHGRLPLEVACLFGSPSLEIVQCLVDHFPAAVEVRTNDNEQRESRSERLPLHYACRGRAPIEVVQYLLEIEPNAIASPGLDGMLPLHEACSSDENDGTQLPPLSLPLIQCLVEKYPNALLVPSSPQLLPLHYASCTKNVPLQVIEYLVKENPNAVEVASHQGLLPLHLAAYFNESSPEVLTLLYESYPAAIEKKDACGCNPLHVACAASAAPDLIMTIISWHPESLRMEDGFGRLPLHIACLTNAPVSLIKHMAELFPQSLVTKDSEGDGDLALDMICRLGEVSEDVIECLVLDGLPPLHFACCYDASIETLRFLNGK
jgi:ankyrin repeat protein